MNGSGEETPRDVPEKKPDLEILYQAQKTRIVGELAAGVAHDFNNILTAVICHIDLVLVNPDLPPSTRDFLNRALAGARRGAELNTKLLQFSRSSEPRPGPVDMKRVVEETILLVRRGLDRRIQIHFSPPKSPLWPARVDEPRFVQAFINLCLNARDAMPRGGDLFVELATHTFAADEAQPPRHAGDFVRVTVRDTGSGMTPEVRGRLFEPYFTTKTGRQGAGLGLFLTHHIVAEHGGWMEVESEPHRGSTFDMFLPRAKAVATKAAKPARTEVVAGPALEGYETILIVDDEPSVRAVMQAMLTFRGYQVLEAQDGVEGLEQFRAAKDRVSLVLLDIQMPRMNGWETMQRMLELKPAVPVVLLSGGVSDPPVDEKATARAAGVVQKPFASGELLRAIRKALDRNPKKR